MRPFLPLLAPLLAVAACATGQGDPLLAPDALGPGSLTGELVYSDAATPPSSKPGQCWADAVTPAEYETDTVHQLLRPAAPGKPAEYQTVTRQRIVKDRAQVWFRTPCPEAMTPDFIGSLQRALFARGYYRGAFTGEMDDGTRAALRRYQAQIGLDSGILALGTARHLGLASYGSGPTAAPPATPEG